MLLSSASGAAAVKPGKEATSTIRVLSESVPHQGWARVNDYRFRFRVSSNISSDVVMVFEFAWYPRWARIIAVNSWAMSTFDCSMALPMRLPRPLVPAVPTLGTPAAWLSPYRLEPSLIRPLGLLELASA